MSYTGKQIFEVIEQAAATSSKKEKEAILATHGHDQHLRDVLIAGLDQTRSYGVTGVVDAGDPDRAGSDFHELAWLVIEGLKSRTLTGNAAQEAIESTLARLDGASGQLLARVLNMDFRAGFSESTVNKAIPGLIREFPYMRCSLPKAAKLDAWPWEEGVISQEKADGMYVTIDLPVSGPVEIRSRQGSEFNIEKFGGVVRMAQRFIESGNQLQGEMLVVGPDGILPREKGNGMLNSVLSGGDFDPGHRPMMVAWDQIPLASAVGKGKFDVPYRQRFERLQTQLTHSTIHGGAVSTIASRVVHSLAEAYAHYRELLALNKEGTILSHPDGIWKDGTSKEKVKLKLEVDVDLVSTEIVPGRAATKNEGRPGSITMVSSCGQLKVDVTIKNEDLRNAVEKDPARFLSKVWAIRANSIMKPAENDELYSLFLPRMVEAGFRTDKSEGDSLVEIQDQFEQAVKAA